VVAAPELSLFSCSDGLNMGQTIGGFYLCTLKKDVTLLRTPQKLVVTYIPSLELFFSLTPFRRHLLLTVGNGSGE